MNVNTIDLYTPSGERLAADRDRIPWEVYPRPTLRRDSYLCLNGWWDFAVTSDGEPSSVVYDQTIRVPYCPESLLSDVHKVFSANSHLWYRREFALPDGFQKDRVILHIGGADQHTWVYVNDRLVGKHRGGYDPISVDSTD